MTLVFRRKAQKITPMKKRSSIISFLLLLIFVVPAICPVAAQKAKNNIHGRTERIKRVENGLLPPVIIKGQPVAVMNIAERMEFYKIPGVSIAVINGGKIEWARGYGVNRAGTDERITPETLFQAASISKPVAAIAGLRLVEQGKINLDSDINERLVTWKVPENEFTREKKVTLRRILSHGAGLTVHGFGGYAMNESVPTVTQILNGEKPANSGPVRVDIVPGTLWRYSGGGFTVFQQMIEDVTQKPFPALMQDMVLKRAGMHHSTYQQPLPESLRPQAASGHDSKGKTVAGNFHVYPEMAAAGLWTTPSDLARFEIALQKSFLGKSNKLLSPKMTEQLLTVQNGEWGLGLRLTGKGDASRFGHNGANEGFQCLMIAYNRTGQGAVIMTNSDNGGQLGGELILAVAREYGWADYAPIEKTLAKVDPVVYDPYVGEYEFSPSFNLTVTREGDKLFASAAEERFELLPESETRFFTLSDISVEFVKDGEGKATHLLLNKTNRGKKIK